MTGSMSEEVHSQAARWVARMDGDDWTDKEEGALQAWLTEDPRREGILLQVQAIWLSIPSGRDTVASDQDALAREEPSMPVERRIGAAAVSRRQLVAASLVGLIASGGGVGYWLSQGSVSYTTGLGEIRRVPLADGSTAAINSESSVQAKIRANERTVVLDKGEAWFQVAHDKARPFTVESGRVRARAVGTAFSVRRGETGSEVTVSEGVVDIWVHGAEGHLVRLHAGEQATVGENAAIRATRLAPGSVERSLAWRDGKIDLAGTPLWYAVQEFNRYNTRKIVLADAKLGRERFDGVFQTTDPDGFAEALRNTLGVSIDRTRPREIRIRAADPRADG